MALPAAPKCTLRPGETCLMCGHTAPLPQSKLKPVCPGCNQEFKTGQKWRLCFRKRWHRACVADVQARAAGSSPAIEVTCAKPGVTDIDPKVPRNDWPESPELFPGDEDLIAQCVEIMRNERRASTSYFQRQLRLGYTRTAHIVRIMQSRGYVGRGEGAKPLQILQLPAI